MVLVIELSSGASTGTSNLLHGKENAIVIYITILRASPISKFIFIYLALLQNMVVIDKESNNRLELAIN